MNSFTVLFFCIQACLLQTVLGQCLGRLAPAIAPCGTSFTPAATLSSPFGYAGRADLAYPGAGFAGLGYPATELTPYGGAGEGNVAVAGELPVAGTTAVAGQVPIMGAVSFGGGVCASGAVSIAGKCDCGCGAPYEYIY